MRAGTKTTNITEYLKSFCRAKTRYADRMETTIPPISRAFFRSMIRAVWVLFFFNIMFVQSAWGTDLGLIHPVELRNTLSDYVVLDGRPKNVWEKHHIPGALSFSWEDYTQTDEKKIPYRVLPPENLAKALGDMGISENTAVVACGDADTSWGGEGWICWVLTWIGHKGPIQLLSGGIQKWEDQGYPIEKEIPAQRRKVTYTVNTRHDVNLTAKDLKRLNKDVVIIDTRSTREWFLEDHVPGAIHIHWKKYTADPYAEVINRQAFNALMTDNGILPGRPIVYYCTGGVRSAFAWFVHELWSKDPAMNFEGGMEAWVRIKH